MGRDRCHWGYVEGRCGGGCAPGGQTRTWESPGATGRSSSASYTESIHPSCLWRGGSPARFLLTWKHLKSWIQALQSPPSLNPSPCTCCFLPVVLLYHKGECLVEGDSLSQLLCGLLSFCWCVVDPGSDKWECTHLAAVLQRLPVDSSSGIFLFLLTGSGSS